MALTYAATAMMASSTLTVGQAKVGAWIDLTGAYQAIGAVKVVNQASAPGTGATVTIDTSPDNGTTIYTGGAGLVQSGSGAGGIFAWDFNLTGVMYARTVFSGNLGNDVNIQADVMKQTGF